MGGGVTLYVTGGAGIICLLLQQNFSNIWISVLVNEALIVFKFIMIFSAVQKEYNFEHPPIYASEHDNKITTGW